MNEELIKALRTVIKEEIEPIKEQIGSFEHHLDSMDRQMAGLGQRFDEVDRRMDDFGRRLDNMDRRMDAFEQRFDNIDERMGVIEKEVKDLKTGQEQLHKSIIQHLGDYTDRITQHVDDQNAALNKRVFVLETEIQRLIRQG
ncbi:hypothetical protein [Siminovitchia fortis]|nr:hypothetical protein [Siminovitchia fortis]